LLVDDTPIKVLYLSRRTADPLARGVKEGGIWVYDRDDRRWAGSDPSEAAYYFSPDRRREHPRRYRRTTMVCHLAAFKGVLQAARVFVGRTPHFKHLNLAQKFRVSSPGPGFAMVRE